MTEPWHKSRPELVEEIRGSLQRDYPALHLVIDGESGRAAVRGTFPVRSPDGVERDRYSVSIELPDDYPTGLPVVREVNRRIPWQANRHVNTDGTCCVLIPDDRWRSFPEGAPFRQFLDGPLYDFFLAQSLVELGEPWPFGQWDHQGAGLLEYYRELLETENDLTVSRFVYVLAQPLLNPRSDCPCGSARKLRDCCLALVVDLRNKIPWHIARTSFRDMNFKTIPYKGRRLK